MFFFCYAGLTILLRQTQRISKWIIYTDDFNEPNEKN